MKNIKLTTRTQLIFAITVFVCFNSYGQWTQKGLDIDGTNDYDGFGHGVSLSADGNTVVSGAPNSGSVAAPAGKVRVFHWDTNSNTWTQKGNDINGNGNGSKFGYDVAISADGNMVLVGAPQSDDLPYNSGQIKIYEWDENLNTWQQKGATIPGESSDDQFGWSVNISADGLTVSAGAKYNSVLGWGTGHVRVFTWNSNTSSWDQKGQDIDGDAASCYAGTSSSMSADGNIVAFGSPFLNNIGQAQVYQWNEANGWVQLGNTIDGDPLDEFFGYSISLNDAGNIIAVGSKGTCSVGQNAGHTRVYELNTNNNTWDQIGSTINGESAWDFSGFSLELSGSGASLVIGALDNDGAPGSNSGHVRVYDWDSNLIDWTQRGLDIDGEAVDNSFGSAVSINYDGTVIAGGSTQNSDGAINAGHVRVFEDLTAAKLATLEKSSELFISPNPNKGQFNLSSNYEGWGLVTLYDLTGRQVYRENILFNKQHNHLDIVNLEKGLYQLVLETKTGNMSVNLLVE